MSHLILGARASTDPRKVKAMLAWPKPTTVRAMRVFLGLIEYYRRFVKGYGVISKPLSNLLRKGNFSSGQELEEAFKKLKEAMSRVLVLGLLDFSKSFVLETDASGIGIGVVLMWGGRPLMFLSQALSPRHLGLSIYEKEFLAVLIAVEKWQHYLKEGDL